MTGWLPIDEAPKDGRWIIGLCNDRITIDRISWGRNRAGELCWCNDVAHFEPGFFVSWVPWPFKTA